MAFKVKITYLDGKVEEFMPNPRARIDTERHFGGFGDSNVQEATIYMAWTHLKKAGKTADEFDTWIDTLADFEEVRVADVRPTQPAQPAAESSD
jgi:hypothetical protein